MIGIKRLAEHLNISIGTVSRALNGRPDVNDETRKRVLEAAARKFGFELKFDEFDWSCDYYEKHGRMMPADGLEQLHDMTRGGELP